jgi:hypothetical protein
MERNFAGSMCMPVEMGLPVAGQRIMSSPIDRSGFSMMDYPYSAGVTAV